jgi:hypothetical protein
MFEGEPLLHARKPCGHLVQLYGPNPSALARNVGRFLSDGLKKGDGLIVIASQENTEAIWQALQAEGSDPDTLVNDGRLVVMDAAKTLGLFMKEDQPDSELFHNTVGATTHQLRARSESGEVSCYGEMVGVLWTEGCFTGAMALEDLWNDLLSPINSKLFCGYPIDVFGPDFHECDLDALLCSHTHFIPAEDNAQLERALFRAMDEVLGARAAEVRSRIKAEQSAPWAYTLRAEAVILWVRRHLSEQADAILARARHASAN